MTTQTKYPNADTSPERLAEIERSFTNAGFPSKQDLTDQVRDLLAMLEEHSAPVTDWKPENTPADFWRSAYVFLQRFFREGKEETASHIVRRLEPYFRSAIQQLHDQRWRRQSVDGMPDFGVPVQLRLRGSLDHGQLKKGYMGAPIYQTQDGFKHSPELKNGEEIWWRPIPPLPFPDPVKSPQNNP